MWVGVEILMLMVYDIENLTLAFFHMLTVDHIWIHCLLTTNKGEPTKKIAHFHPMNYEAI